MSADDAARRRSLCVAPELRKQILEVEAILNTPRNAAGDMTDSVMRCERYKQWRQQRRRTDAAAAAPQPPAKGQPAAGGSPAAPPCRRPSLWSAAERQTSTSRVQKAFESIHHLPQTPDLVAWLSLYGEALKAKILQLQVDEHQVRYGMQSAEHAAFAHMVVCFNVKETALQTARLATSCERSEITRRVDLQLSEHNENETMLTFELLSYVAIAKPDLPGREVLLRRHHEAAQARGMLLLLRLFAREAGGGGGAAAARVAPGPRSPFRTLTARCRTFAETHQLALSPLSSALAGHPSPPDHFPPITLTEATQSSVNTTPRTNTSTSTTKSTVSHRNFRLQRLRNPKNTRRCSASQPPPQPQEESVAEEEADARSSLQKVQNRHFRAICVEEDVALLRIFRRFDTVVMLEERSSRKTVCDEFRASFDDVLLAGFRERKQILEYLRAARELLADVDEDASDARSSLCGEERVARLLLHEEKLHDAAKTAAAGHRRCSLTLDACPASAGVLHEEEAQRRWIERFFAQSCAALLVTRQLFLVRCLESEARGHIAEEYDSSVELLEGLTLARGCPSPGGSWRVRRASASSCGETATHAGSEPCCSSTASTNLWDAGPGSLYSPSPEATVRDPVLDPDHAKKPFSGLRQVESRENQARRSLAAAEADVFAVILNHVTLHKINSAHRLAPRRHAPRVSPPSSVTLLYFHTECDAERARVCALEDRHRQALRHQHKAACAKRVVVMTPKTAEFRHAAAFGGAVRAPAAARGEKKREELEDDELTGRSLVVHMERDARQQAYRDRDQTCPAYKPRHPTPPSAATDGDQVNPAHRLAPRRHAPRVSPPSSVTLLYFHTECDAERARVCALEDRHRQALRHQHKAACAKRVVVMTPKTAEFRHAAAFGGAVRAPAAARGEKKREELEDDELTGRSLVVHMERDARQQAYRDRDQTCPAYKPRHPTPPSAATDGDQVNPAHRLAPRRHAPRVSPPSSVTLLYFHTECDAERARVCALEDRHRQALRHQHKAACAKRVVVMTPKTAEFRHAAAFGGAVRAPAAAREELEDDELTGRSLVVHMERDARQQAYRDRDQTCPAYKPRHPTPPSAATDGDQVFMTLRKKKALGLA
ncbi:hypothetical protein DIPPA_16611 [Diplonema papillatum]|nr:hypothetical protein DIPPA_16611 [Diplonema papillatum]